MASASSLRSLDPVADLLARLRLDKAARRRGAAITEGPSDNRVLNAALGISEKVLFPVGGQGNVLRCARALEDSPMSGVICLADRDFNASEEHWPEAWWLVFYDDADVEAMLVESEALTRVLEEWASKPKLERFGGIDAVRVLARESTGPLAILRAVNARESLGLPFDVIELQDLFEKKTGKLRIASLVGRFVERSQLDHAELEKALADQRPICPNTKKPLARGRDLIAVITILLRRLIGSLSKQQAGERFVERSLRLALRPGDLDDTPFRSRFDAAMQRATTM